MTTIKIPFTKKNIKTIPADKLAPGTKGLELEIQTDFYIGAGLGVDLTKCHGGTPDNTFTKMVFVFKDDGGQLVYDSLNDNQNFELIFDKEKVFLMIGGFSSLIDKTKPEIQVYPASDSRLMTVFFETKFAGIITLESKNSEDNPPKKDNPNKDNPPNVNVVRNYCKSNDIKNLTYDEETEKLIIEYKQDKPNKEISDLSGELAEIKNYLLKKGQANGKKRSLVEADWEREYQNTQEQKTNYTPWLIGGGILLFVIVILALVGMTKSNRRD